MPDPNGWNEWSRHVLAELERLGDAYDKLVESVQNLRVTQRELKVKAGIWGLFGGAIPVVVGLLVWLLKSQL